MEVGKCVIFLLVIVLCFFFFSSTKEKETWENLKRIRKETGAAKKTPKRVWEQLGDPGPHHPAWQKYLRSEPIIEEKIKSFQLQGEETMVSILTDNYFKFLVELVKSQERLIPNIRKKSVFFALDKEAFKKCQELDLNVIYLSEFGEFSPSDMYADGKFGKIMIMKNVAIYSVLKFTQKPVLFEDVDVMWTKDPLPLLQKQKEDISFMRDKNVRFEPTYINSGFMFIRNNPKTREAYLDCLKDMAYVLHLRSHQQAMNYVIQWHMKNKGLTIKTLKPTQFMDGSARKEEHDDVYVYHYNWTANEKVKPKRMADFTDIATSKAPFRSVLTKATIDKVPAYIKKK